MLKPLLSTLIVLFQIFQLESGGPTAPFEIPPHGNPEKLLGRTVLEAPTAMAFDSKNRPYMINNRNFKSFGKLKTIRNGKWITQSFLELFNQERLPSTRNYHGTGELVIDDQDSLYATVGNKLIYSPDLGKTFKAYPCKGSLEVRTGSWKFTLPPVISQLTDTQKVKGMRWGGRSQLSILIPKKVKGGLLLGKPIEISENCMTIGSGGHSGGTSYAVTTDNLTHIVYTILPEDTTQGGNPIHIATIDRRNRSVIAKELLVVADPINPDIHTRPTITADSKGYLHVLSGSHGTPFYYLRSLKPHDITKGWTKPVKLMGRQCYASIVCDQQGTVHSVFREWIPHASLGYSSKIPEVETWLKPTTLVHGANPRGKYAYGIFYHRLFIDRESNLFLSFTFWERNTNKNGVYPEALAFSKDFGKTWSLAKEKTFLPIHMQQGHEH